MRSPDRKWLAPEAMSCCGDNVDLDDVRGVVDSLGLARGGKKLGELCV